jgi:hypothetical protein
MIKQLVIAIVILSSFAAVFSVVSKTSFRDSEEYLFAAQNIKTSGVLYAGDETKDRDYRLYSKRPLAYPLLLAINPYSTRIVQVLLVLLMGFGSIALLRKQRYSLQKLRVFLWLFLLTPLLLLHPGFILADFVFSCAILFFFFGLLYYGLFKWNVIFWWCIAALMKPVLFPTVLLWVVALFVSLFLKKTRWLKLSIPILLVIGVFARNFKKTGVAEYSSISSINLAYYNAKLTLTNKFGMDSADRFIDDACFATPRNKEDYKEYASHLKERATSVITGNMVSYLKVHFLGTVKMILDPGRFEIYHFLGMNEEASLTELLFSGNLKKLYDNLLLNPLAFGLYLLFLVVSVVKLIGFFLAFTTKSSWKNPLMLLGLLFIGYFVGVTGPIGAGRFMLPVILIYNVLAVEGLYRFKKSSKS